MKRMQLSAIALLAVLGLAAAACGQPLTTAEQTQTTVAALSPVATTMVAVTTTAIPTAQPTAPPVMARTPIPGAARGGLFADGATALPAVATSDWKTYTSSKYGFTLQYPPDWQLTESDSTGHYGPNGEPSYPLFRVEVSNPVAEQGKKIPGQTCSAAANDCPGPPPGLLSFMVEIWGTGSCNIAGDLIVSDNSSIAGRVAAHCVVEYPNDRSRTAAYAVPLADGTYLVAQAGRGNAVTSAQQAVLETVMSTFVFLAAPQAGTP